MIDLVAKTPCAGLLPITHGAQTLSEVDAGHLTLIAPYAGQGAALSNALEKAHGLAMPTPNRMTEAGGARAIWFGQDAALLMGPAPDASLATYAALTDQSDAWAMVRLDGPQAAEVLARLTPIDLRGDHFQPGHTARTELAHMAASITCVGPGSYMIATFRSMARTLAHDLETAMQGVAARHAG